MASGLLHLGEAALVQLALPGAPQRLGDGVVRELLGEGGGGEELLLADAFRGPQLPDGEAALGQGAGLVEDHGLHLGEILQMVAALHQDAALGGPADAAEEAQRHGDDQRAGAGDDQEDEGPVEPVLPHGANQEARQHGGEPEDEGRDQEEGQGRDDHAGGIVMGEAGDEGLALGLAIAGVLHQLQDPGDGGLLAGLRHLDAEKPRLVDAAAEDLVPAVHVPGHGLAGESGGIQGGAALGDGAVQRHPLAGLHHDGLAHGHVLHVHLFDVTVPFHEGGVRPQVHQLADGGPGAVHGHILEELTGLVEEHDEDGLGVVPGAVGAHGGESHQEVLVKDLAVDDAKDGLAQHVVADDEEGDQVEGPDGEGKLRQELHDQKQRRRDDDAPQDLLLFLVESFHGNHPFGREWGVSKEGPKPFLWDPPEGGKLDVIS